MFRTLSYHGPQHLIACRRWSVRSYSFSTTSAPLFTTPKPPSLPSEDQKEWEESMHRQQPFIPSNEDSEIHPDARKPVAPDFEGDVNPMTGEIGGPKKEPLTWGAGGEWTYGGRATDF